MPSPRDVGAVPRLLLSRRARIERGLFEALRGDSPLLQILRYHAGLEDGEGTPSHPTGKFLRPSLVLFAAEELGEGGAPALSAAVAVELIHEFSLLHDDIEDGDRTRHGRAGAWVRYGLGQAINAGDLMHALAFSAALEAGPRVSSALSQATSIMIEGQGLDLSLGGRRASVDDWLEMEGKKTGALFSCAFRLGAIVAGVPPGVEETLAALGGEVGLAFQIRDDLLGVWGSEEETGKPRGSDLRARKSLLLAIALERATGGEKTALESAYGRPNLSDVDVDRLVAILERLGARQVAEQMVAERLARAKVVLEGVPFRPGAKEELGEFLAYLVGRTR